VSSGLIKKLYKQNKLR